MTESEYIGAIIRDYLKPDIGMRRDCYHATILVILGWRLFFYANEGKEPIHVHCQKGDMECKYWLDRDYFSIEEAFAYNISPRDARQIRKIIYEHFEYIEQQWDEFKRRRGR